MIDFKKIFKKAKPVIERKDGTSGNRYSMTCECGCTDLTIDESFGNLDFDDKGWFRFKKITCRKCKKTWHEKRRLVT